MGLEYGTKYNPTTNRSPLCGSIAYNLMHNYGKPDKAL
jgi:hypothetical protein